MESIGAKKYIFANFHVLGHFIPKKQARVKKFFRLSRGVAVRALVEI
jgi:hypothetical protein